MLQGKTTLYDASPWTHFSDDYPCEAVAFSWHACSPRDHLGKLSAAHGHPNVAANCKRYSSKSSYFYVFMTYHPHVRTNLFHHIAMSSCHHVIMSSCHHAVKVFGTQGERVMRPGVRHGLATLRDNMGTGESNKKSGWNNHPRVRSIRRFSILIRSHGTKKVPRSAAIMTGSRWGYWVVYQSSRRSFLGKYILSPGFTPKASYHMSMWGSAPLTRHSPRAWGSLFVRLRISFSVMLAAQTPE